MEHLGTISESVCWNSLNGMCSEEADFGETFLDSLSNNKVSNSYVSPTFWSYSHEESSGNNNDHSDAMYCRSYSSDDYTYDFSSVYSISQGSDRDNGIFLLHSSASPRNHLLLHNLQVSEMDYNHMMEDKNNSLSLHILKTANSTMEVAGDFLSQDVISSDRIESNGNSRKDDHTAPRSTYDSSSKKRSRSNMNEKNKRSIKSKRAVKIDDDDEDDNNNTENVTIQRQNSNSICSEEHSNDSHGVTASRSNIGKTRASRGSATDPQSLYARKRRERINERLRVLQNLVPNGTKVDISTMLEEAVRYVKFLQLQIKLLSSDDLWMYAPIAYNGMDIGLDLKNISSTTLKSQLKKDIRK